MYISKIKDNINFIELNDIELKVMQKMIDKLIFSPDGVSNQFKATEREIVIVNQMRNNLNGALTCRL